MNWTDRIRRLALGKALAPHLAEGQRGESIAVRFLRKNGYRILDRNVRIPSTRDEIDIVAFDPVDCVYVFAEVKTRSKNDQDYHPEINITPEKRSRMARAARRYMMTRDEDVGYRLDVICVADGKVVEHYPEIAWTS